MAPRATSRIPKSKSQQAPSSSSSIAVPTSGTLSPNPIDIPSLHASLSTLKASGVPEVSVEDLRRLAQGPFGDALVFLSEHVRGRKEAASARGQLNRLYQNAEHMRKLQNGELELSHTRVQKATSRLGASQKTAEALQKELDEQQAALELSQREELELQEEIDHQRRVNMLLGVLEAKEGLRAKRIEEMTKILDASRKILEDSDSQVLPPLLLDFPAPNHGLQGISTLPQHITRAPERIPRPTYTRDTLASLHAHHIRFASESHSRISYEPPHIPPADPAHLLGNLDEKSKNLKMLSDVCTAYEVLCEQLIKTTSTPLTPLKSFLAGDAAQVPGYVDKLRDHIISCPKNNEKECLFKDDVKRICGLRGAVSLPSILKEAERLVEDVHRRDKFLAQAVLAPSSPPSSATDVTALLRTTSRRARAQKTDNQTLCEKVGKARGKAEEAVKSIEQVKWEVGALWSGELTGVKR